MNSFINIFKKNYYYKFNLYIFLIILLITAIISYIFKINLSSLFSPHIYNDFLLSHNIYGKNGGVVNDLKNHWSYTQLLKEDFTNLLNLQLGFNSGAKLINFPLHHIIFSKISFITSLKSYILFFFILSFTLPFIIYKTLQTRFESLDQSKIILLSSIIVIFPVFQYSAIWGNNHITALIFLGIGIIFYNKFLQDFKLVNLIFSVIFFAFTCYTKQFYVFLFLFLIADIYNKIFLKDFIKVLILIFLCGLPGLFFVIQNPLLLFGFSQKVTNFPSSILISGSIIFFYLIPFIIQNFINLSGNLRSKLQFYLNTKILFLSAIILLLCIFSFKYNGSIGGGIFLKLSTLLTESYIIFYFTSILGIYFLYFFSNKNFSGLILATLLLITFSSGFFIFQKYFEPMIYIFFLNFFDKNLVLNSIKNSNLILIIYYTAYYIVLNYIYFFGL